MLKRLFAVLAVVLLAACDLPFSSDDADAAIRARAEAPTLSITNSGGRAVRYLVFDPTELASWARCGPDQPECPTLAPGETNRVSYSAIGGYDDGDAEAVVLWWIDEPVPGGGYRRAAEGEVRVRL